MADNAQYQLDLILRATDWVKGSKEGTKAIEQLSSKATAAGLSIDEFATKIIKSAQAQRKSGKISLEAANVLAQVEAKYASLAASIGKEAGKPLFGDAFQRAKEDIAKVTRATIVFGDTSKTIFNALKAGSPFEQLKIDMPKLQQEIGILEGAFGRLFGGELGGAREFREIFRSVSLATSGSSRSVGVLTQEIIKVRDAFAQLKPDPKVQTTIQGLEQVLSQLSSTSSLTKEQFNQIRDTILKLTGNVFGLESVSRDLVTGWNRSGEAGKQGFKKTGEEALKTLNRIQDIIKAEQEFAAGMTISPPKKQFIGMSSEEQDRYQAESYAAYKKFNEEIRKSKVLNDINRVNAKSVEGLKKEIRDLDTFLNKYKKTTVGVITPSRELAAEMNRVARNFGFTVKEGENISAFMGRLGDAQRRLSSRLKETVSAQERMTRATREATTGLAKFDELTSIAIQKIIRYRVAFYLMSSAIQGLRTAIDTFKDVQSELAQIEKVIEPIPGQMKELKQEAFGFAQEFGTSVVEVINIMKVFAQQGKNFAEILDLTRTTLLAANAAGLTTEQAVEGLTAITKAYNISASELIGTIDKLTEVQARHAVTSQDLIDSIRTIASAANSVGVDLDNLIGLTTAIATVTRKSGKAVSQSLKTIFARIERAETINQFRELNIEIQNTDGSIRDLDQVLRELNSIWDDLTDAQRFNIAQSVAGVRRYADFLVLMDNFDEAIIATKDSINAQGRAQRNNIIELQTFSRQIKIVQASLQETFEGIAESGLVQSAEGLLGLAKFFTTIQNAVPGLSLLTAAFAQLVTYLAASKGLTILGGLAWRQYEKTVGDVTGINKILVAQTAAITDAKTREAVADAITNLKLKERSALNKVVISGDRVKIALLIKEIAANKVKNKQLTESAALELRQVLARSLLNKETIAAAKATGLYAFSIRSLGAAFKSLFGPTGLIFLALEAITLLGFAFFKAETSQASYTESTLETARGLKKSIEAELDVRTELDKRIKKIDTLQKAMDSGRFTEEQYILALGVQRGELKKLIVQYPQLAKAVDTATNRLKSIEQANKVLEGHTEKVEKLRESYEETSRQIVLAAIKVQQGVNEILTDIQLNAPELLDFAEFEKDGKTLIEATRNLRNQLEKERERFGKQPVIKPSQFVDFETKEQTITKQIESFANNYVDTFVEENEDAINKALPDLKRLRLQLSTTSQPTPEELLKVTNAKEFGKELKKQIKELIDAGELTENSLQGIITPTLTLVNVLNRVGSAGAEAAKEFLDYSVSIQTAAKTGFSPEVWNKLIENVIVKVDEAIKKFKDFQDAVRGTGITALNTADIMRQAGFGFNRIEAEAKQAEETLKAVNNAILALEGAGTEPIRVAEAISKLDLPFKKLKTNSVEAVTNLRAMLVAAGKSEDEFAQILAAAIRDGSDFSEVIGDTISEGMGDSADKIVDGGELIRRALVDSLDISASFGKTLEDTKKNAESLGTTFSSEVSPSLSDVMGITEKFTKTLKDSTNVGEAFGDTLSSSMESGVGKAFSDTLRVTEQFGNDIGNAASAGLGKSFDKIETEAVDSNKQLRDITSAGTQDIFRSMVKIADESTKLFGDTLTTNTISSFNEVISAGRKFNQDISDTLRSSAGDALRESIGTEATKATTDFNKALQDSISTSIEFNSAMKDTSRVGIDFQKSMQDSVSVAISDSLGVAINDTKKFGGQFKNEFKQLIDEARKQAEKSGKPLSEEIEVIADIMAGLDREISFDQLYRGLLEVGELTEDDTAKLELQKVAVGALTDYFKTKLLPVAIAQGRAASEALFDQKNKLEEVQKSLEIYNSRVSTLVETFTNLGKAAGLSAREQLKFDELRTRSIEKQARLQTQIYAIGTLGYENQEEIASLIEDETSLLGRYYKRRVDILTLLDNERKIKGEIKAEEEEAIEFLNETKKLLERNLASVKSTLDITQKISEERNKIVGLIGRASEVEDIENRINALKQEKALINDFLETQGERVDVTELLGKTEEELLEIWDGNIDAVKEFKDLVGRVGARETKDLLDKVRDINTELNNLGAESTLIRTFSEIDKVVVKFEYLNNVFQDQLDIEKKIAELRADAFGVSSARIEANNANIKADALRYELASNEKLVEVKNKLLRAGIREVELVSGSLGNQTELVAILQERAELSDEAALALARESKEFLEYYRNIRQADLEKLFYETKANIEETVTQLAFARDRFNELTKAQFSFINQSRTFRKIAGKDALLSAQAELQFLEDQKKVIDEQVDALGERIQKYNLVTLAQDKSAGQAALDAQRIVAQWQGLQNESKIFNDQIERAQLNARFLSITLSEGMKEAVKQSERFNDLIEGAADTVASAFRGLPEAVSNRFQTIVDLQTEIVDKEQQIIDARARLDPLSNDYARALQEIRELEDEQKDLEDSLRKSKDLVYQLGVGAAKLGEQLSNVVLDIQTDILKESLANILSDAFGSAEKRRAILIKQALDQGAENIYAKEWQGFFEGGNYIYNQIVSALSGAGAITAAGKVGAQRINYTGGTYGATGSFNARNVDAARTINDASNKMKEAGNNQLEASNDFSNAAKSLSVFLGQTLGTAIGGGGKGAATGAQIGAAAGAFIPVPGAPFITSAIGGLIGGAFDKETKIPELKDAVEDNTSATNKNTQELQDLRDQLINAPARFTVPAFARVGGQLPAGYVGNEISPVIAGTGGVSINVPITIYGSADQQTIQNVRSAVRDGYEQGVRRIGKRVIR